MTETTDTRPAVASITEADINDGKTMAILAYIFFLIPLLAARDKKFAMFHTEQAIALWIAFIVIYIAMWILTFIVGIVTCGIGYILFLPLLVLYIIGIINAVKGEVKPVPLIGQWGDKFNLVK